jgi:hypothetical protein
MTRNQGTQYAMFIRMANLLATTSPEVKVLMPKMEASETKLNENILEIKACLETQNTNKKGITVGKGITKKDVANAAFQLSGKVKSYAIDENLHDLKSEVSFSLSKLVNMADENLIAATEIIVSKATKNLANLASYGVTEPLIEETKHVADNYQANIPKPKESIINKKIATARLKVVMPETISLIQTNMGTYVIIVKDSQSVFYNDFQLTRIAADPISYPIDFRCNIKNQDGQPLQKVNCKIEGQSKVYKTTEKGNFEIKSFPSGNHNCTFQAYGYATQTLIVPTTKGVRKNLSITLLANT